MRELPARAGVAGYHASLQAKPVVGVAVSSGVVSTCGAAQFSSRGAGRQRRAYSSAYWPAPGVLAALVPSDEGLCTEAREWSKLDAFCMDTHPGQYNPPLAALPCTSVARLFAEHGMGLVLTDLTDDVMAVVDDIGRLYPPAGVIGVCRADRFGQDSPPRVGHCDPELACLCGLRLASGLGVAFRLRITPETVRRWLRTGKLRGALLGGDKMGYLVCDVRDPGSCDAQISAALDRHGAVDVLAHAAAIPQRKVLTVELAPEEWDRVRAINVRGAFLLCRSVIPVLPKRRNCVHRLVFWADRTGPARRVQRVEGGVAFVYPEFGAGTGQGGGQGQRRGARVCRVGHGTAEP